MNNAQTQKKYHSVATFTPELCATRYQQIANKHFKNIIFDYHFGAKITIIKTEPAVLEVLPQYLKYGGFQN